MKDKAVMKKEDKKEYAWMIISLLLTAWLIWSWFEVITHNMVDETYSKLNCFRIISAVCNYIHG